MPASRSDFSSTSLSNSFRPTKDTVAMIGALVDDDDHDLVLDLDAHVLEQAGGEQRAQRGGALVVGVGVADAKRQRAEHRARVGALQALDADVLDDEGLAPRAPRARQQAASSTRQASTRRSTRVARRDGNTGSMGRDSVQAQQAGHVVEEGHRHQDQQDGDAAALQPRQPELGHRATGQTPRKDNTSGVRHRASAAAAG